MKNTDHTIILADDGDFSYCATCLRNVWPIGTTPVQGTWPVGTPGTTGGHLRTPKAKMEARAK